MANSYDVEVLRAFINSHSSIDEAVNAFLKFNSLASPQDVLDTFTYIRHGIPLPSQTPRKYVPRTRTPPTGLISMPVPMPLPIVPIPNFSEGVITDDYTPSYGRSAGKSVYYEELDESISGMLRTFCHLDNLQTL